MRKRELIHLHGLAAELASFCEADGLTLDLEPYRRLDTSPIDITDTKDAHHTAVLTLTDELSGSLTDGGHEPVRIEET